MVIQQLQGIKHILQQNPPDIALALRELDIAMQVAIIAMQVAIQEWEMYNQQPPTPSHNWHEIVRPNDELLKEFGW